MNVEIHVCEIAIRLGRSQVSRKKANRELRIRGQKRSLQVEVGSQDQRQYKRQY